MRSLAQAFKLLSVGLSAAAMLLAYDTPAQIPGFDGAPAILQRPQLGAGGSGCPVFVTANQRSLAQVFEAGSIPLAPHQGATVTLSSFRGHRILNAEIVAHALSPKNRTVLASDEETDLTRSFHLVARENGEFTGDLWMEGVTAIRWIEVKSLTYSNGTVWHESDTRKCIVRPDPLVLISSAR